MATLTAAHAAGQAWERAREDARARSRVRDAAAAHDRLTAAADDHAADVARLEAGRRAEGLRPLARLVDERRRRLGDADDVTQRRPRRGHRLTGSTWQSCPRSSSRLTHEVSALTVLLPAEQRLTELRARHESAGRRPAGPAT